MNEEPPKTQRLRLPISILVRGMSAANKFFEEKTLTLVLGERLLITRLENRVELEAELHVTNLMNQVGGAFRVVWINSEAREGGHDAGLELLEAEGNLWGMEFPAVEGEADAGTAQAWLQCQRCHEGRLTSVPEAEDEFIRDGFLISRPCEHCRATTTWGFTPAEEAAESSRGAVGQEAGEKSGRDQRRKGRAPINLQIRVTREKYGTVLEDVCETINVSRNGVYFLSTRNYDVGELVEVVVPYKEGDVTIPVSARVVRQDEPGDSFYHAVAVKLENLR
ncbi:MAG: PilZ domain-containing protein [Acidobacteriia bacterium]|nr:PilZ domain-containing protein [Terriglobia bacterium]